MQVICLFFFFSFFPTKDLDRLAVYQKFRRESETSRAEENLEGTYVPMYPFAYLIYMGT